MHFTLISCIYMLLYRNDDVVKYTLNYNCLGKVQSPTKRVKTSGSSPEAKLFVSLILSRQSEAMNF